MTENDHSVLLIGERGVGKSSLISDRLKITCDDDISDVFYITVNCNSFVFSFHLKKIEICFIVF
jgi:predicted AAA+ superfamily ATPase